MPASAVEDRVNPPAPGRGHPAAVAVATAVALAMWGARAAWSGIGLEFLVWNLFLAWIPWFAGRGVAFTRAPAAVAASGAVWLLFLPNAPYLLTDLVHLRSRPPTPLWFDVLLFAAFGLAGCALAWASLGVVHARLHARLGRPRAAAAMSLVLFLTGFGVYLGRFLRWNSWDVVTAPGALLAAAAAAIATPRALVFSAAFAALVGAGYLLVAPRLEEGAGRSSGPAS